MTAHVEEQQPVEPRRQRVAELVTVQPPPPRVLARRQAGGCEPSVTGGTMTFAAARLEAKPLSALTAAEAPAPIKNRRRVRILVPEA